MNVTYLCLGGNIGDREKALEMALLEISKTIGDITAKSKIYETEAWGVENQQAYLNQCVEVKTPFTSEDLMIELLHIEKELGRERIESETYEPRTIDLDVLFYNKDCINTPLLQIPHPRLHLRKFVLIPLNEIATEFLHPLLNKSTFNLLSECKDNSDVKLFKANL